MRGAWLAVAVSLAACALDSPAVPTAIQPALTTCAPDVWSPNELLHICRHEDGPPCARANAVVVPLPDGRALHIGGARQRKAADDVVEIRWILVLEVFAAERRHPVAADEILEGLHLQMRVERWNARTR